MPRFRYKAYDQQGALIEGDIEAAGFEAARAALFDRNLLLFATVPAIQTKLPWWQQEITFGSSLSGDELALFTREFATLLSAEIPLDLVLGTLTSHVSSRRQRQIAQDLRNRVLAGSSLSDALLSQGSSFPSYFASIVRAGEAGGSLRSAFDQLAQFQERALDVRSRIRSALVYPAILLVMAVAAIALILTVLVPALLPLFEEQQAAAPMFIQIFIVLQRFFAEEWIACLGVCGVLALALVAIFRSEPMRAHIDGTILKLAVVGSLVAKAQTARLARTLAALLKSGVPMIQALTIGRTVLSNRLFIRAVSTMLDRVNQGETLRQSMADAVVFPSVAVRLVAVGEESGRLDELLLRVAEMFESQVQREVDRLMSLMTPLLTLCIGLLVGGLMMSVMNAILSINDLAAK